MRPGDGTELERVALAITDEVAVDWDAECRGEPAHAARLEGLRLLERIATVFRSGDAPTSAAPDGARWGPLVLGERLGEGAYGVVYRAHDPRLQRDVALKLLRDDLPGGGAHARRILAEARLMARVRHPNVLVIHGADEHDGRAGFWTDLVAGETLEARLDGGARLGADEAALVGRELCRALSAVHAAGLVHGDVKASNVMRDQAGRILLMDFGAGSDRAAASAGAGPLRGTPLVLAPEVLAGADPTPAADLYALGALLFRLVTGRYPVEAADLADLRRRHAAGGGTPLLDLRPDLPAAFVRMVERALAADPADRFPSAGAMAEALAACLSAGRRGRGRKGRWWLIAAVIATVAIAVPAARQIGHAWSAAHGPLDGSVTYLRTSGGADEPLAEATLVRPGDTLGLLLKLSAPAHVYVLNEDESGAVFVLFPLAATGLRNPLPGGQTVRLPGARAGRRLDWEVTDGRGEEHFLLVAAREPVVWLEAQLPDFAAPAADPEPHYRRLDPRTLNPERGVGAVTAPHAAGADGPLVLDLLAARIRGGAADSSAVWLHRLMLYNLGR